MTKWLPRRQFGDPLLRQKARKVSRRELQSDGIQQLIRNMEYTLTSLELGVALAAPQVGVGKRIVVIRIRPLAHRPQVVPLDLVLVNPEIVRLTGRKTQKWEGCISGGEHNAGWFAKVPRYQAVTVQYTDEFGHEHTERYAGLPAQIIQHEVDHLNGILFVDHVQDSKTYVTYDEYLKLITRR